MNSKLYKMHGMYIKIFTTMFQPTCAWRR